MVISRTILQGFPPNSERFNQLARDAANETLLHLQPEQMQGTDVEGVRIVILPVRCFSHQHAPGGIQ